MKAYEKSKSPGSGRAARADVHGKLVVLREIEGRYGLACSHLVQRFNQFPLGNIIVSFDQVASIINFKRFADFVAARQRRRVTRASENAGAEPVHEGGCTR